MTAGKLLILTALLAGCPTPVGATRPVPHDAAATCGGYCQGIGLTLESVVIMANNVGCVCAVQPTAPAPAPAPAAAPASAGGMAAIMMQEAAEESQRQQQSQQNATHH